MSINQADMKRFLEDKDAFAFNLLAAFLGAYGHLREEGDDSTPVALRWTPETIEMELKQDFDAEPPAGNFAKLFTAISILTSNSFFQSEADFAHDCAVLSGSAPIEGQMVLPDAEDVAWGVTEALLICPPESDNPFSEAVLGFIKEVVASAGITRPPDVLRLATPDASISSRISENLADDPSLQTAFADVQQANTDQINQVVNTNLQKLLLQASRIPIPDFDLRVPQRLLQRLSKAQ